MKPTTATIISAYRSRLIAPSELGAVLTGLMSDVVDELAQMVGIIDGSKTDKVAVIVERQSELEQKKLDEPVRPGGSGNGDGQPPPPPPTDSKSPPDNEAPRRKPIPRVSVTLGEERVPTRGDLLSNVIRARSEKISFDAYSNAINEVVCQEATGKPYKCRTFIGTDVFESIKKATLEFLRCECDLETLVASSDTIGANTNAIAADIYDNEALSYWNKIAEQLLGTNQTLPAGFFTKDNCDGVLAAVARGDCVIELIWSYWYEEAMLVQTMQTIAYRFQNRRRGDRDPLASFEIDPLRPLNNIIWGYVQDERNQLSVARRAHEYDHHYGLRLKGRAVGNFNPIDSRERFLEAFHHLLYLCTVFYKEENDNTYQADGFPILTALQELHVILAEGAHNQFGDLPTQARAEMLMMQWILSRAETREFLPGRASVPYREPWMGRVEAMRTLQGWQGASINHFSILAEFGERLLLSARLGNWMDIQNPMAGANWADFWRTEVQQYVHSYRAVTGVDLASEATTTDQLKLRKTLPSELIERAAR